MKLKSDLINKTKNFKIKTKRPKITRQNLLPGIYITIYLICNFTYHCKFSNDEDKKNCCPMNILGNCTLCRKKSRWEEHLDVVYIIKHIEIEVEETVE